MGQRSDPRRGRGVTHRESECLRVLIAELTHRCPLRCAYCSNPLELAPGHSELPSDVWASVFEQAAALGVLQVHLTGGEPALRGDLETIARSAAATDCYTTLVTSGLQGRERVSRDRLQRLVDAGVRSVQVSFQDTRAEAAVRVAGRDATAEKLAFARDVVRAGVSLTTNFVLHRHNIERLDRFVELSIELGAERIELAQAQYHGFAERNQLALLPTAEQIEEAAAAVARAKQRYAARAELIYVMPDMYSGRAKRCMGGWGTSAMVVDPAGRALPCHAAGSLPLPFDRVTQRPLAEIWSVGEAFTAFRGEAWMKAPCRECPERERDLGGCRCQAWAMTGELAAPDPACSRAPQHGLVQLRRATTAAGSARQLELRRHVPGRSRRSLLQRTETQRDASR